MPPILIIIFFFSHPLCRGLYRGQNNYTNNRYGHYGNLSAAAVNHPSLDGIYFVPHPNT